MDEAFNKIKISVIIPLYNTEKFISQTVRCIMNQSLHDLEIIIINDGSTDNSLEVITNLAKQDSRIRIISQNNKGVSASRNIGLNLAKGEYIYFMDSDDLIAEEALKVCYHECINRNLDFITFDAESFISESNIINVPYLLYDRSKSLDSYTTYVGIQGLDIQIKNKCYTPSVCLLMIKKTFLISNSIYFYEGIIHEDQLFTTRAYMEANAVGYIPRKYFSRRLRADSIMTSSFNWKNIVGYLTVFRELYGCYAKRTEKYKLVNRFLYQMMNAVIYNAHTLPPIDRIRLFRLCIFTNLRNYVSIHSKLVLLLKK